MRPGQRERSKLQRGFTLIEALVAVSILGFIGVAFMSGLGGLFRSQDIFREQVRGGNLVRVQLEEIRRQPYLGNYNTECVPPCVPPPGVSVPQGYSITVVTQPFCSPQPCTPPDDNIQKNTVTVSRGNKGLVTVEDLKTKR